MTKKAFLFILSSSLRSSAVITFTMHSFSKHTTRWLTSGVLSRASKNMRPYNRRLSVFSCRSQSPFLPSSGGPNLRTNHRCTSAYHHSLRVNHSTSAAAAADATDKNNFVITRRRGMRCVAIVAHVDHGKTSLVDQLLKASSSQQSVTERLLDSSDLEKERGITITSKVTRLTHHVQNQEDEESSSAFVINIADTPGHADFSAEVDRFLSVADGFLLLVDAAEGPKSQTKYVLSRALALGLKPVVVLNKCDRSDAIAKIDSGETELQIMELFENLGASERQRQDTTIVYASAREGWMTVDPLEALELAEQGYQGEDEFHIRRLLDLIVEEIPEPAVRLYGTTESVPSVSKDDIEKGNQVFSLAAVSVGMDPYLGRTCSGRVTSGSVGLNDSVVVVPRTDSENNGNIASAAKPTNISGVFVYEGIERTPLEERAYAGDVVTLSGVPERIAVGDTLTDDPDTDPLETAPLAPPTLAMDFAANDGPLAGKEGTILASSKVRDRLVSETDNNVTLKVEASKSDSEKTTVFARGELQLGILVEQMRREGFEMAISPPRILTKTCPETGETLEPYEEVIIDVDSNYAGSVMNIVTGDRKGNLLSMSEESVGQKTQLVFEMPTRGMLGGFNSELATATRGSAVVNHIYIGDRSEMQLGSNLDKGRLVSNEKGKASSYALSSLEARGTLFVGPGDPVYSGMVIGENNKSGDLEVNPVRAKQASNMRTQAKDEKAALAPPKRMTVEELIGYMSPDEMIEVTPQSVRLRKQILDPGARERAARQLAKQRRNQKS